MKRKATHDKVIDAISITSRNNLTHSGTHGCSHGRRWLGGRGQSDRAVKAGSGSGPALLEDSGVVVGRSASEMRTKGEGRRG